MRVEFNPANGAYILYVPETSKAEVAALMAYRGLTFSTAASTAKQGVLFSNNPYSVCDLASDVPELAAYKANIEASRALNGVGTKKLPPGKELWDYQKASFDYVYRRGGGIIGDEPGLGKTPISLAFSNAIEAWRNLVIVPASIRLQWADKIREWSTIPNVKVSTMLNVKDGINPTAHYQIISYDAARNPAIIQAIGRYQWDLLIADEAHKMKNSESLTTRAILGNAKGMYQHGEHKLPAIAKACKHHLALTGTLLLNRPSEAYVLLRHFDHESIDFASEDKFKERYNRQALIKTIEGKRHNLESTSLERELNNRLRVNIMTRHEKRTVLTQMKTPRYEVIRLSETAPVKAALAQESLLELDIDQIKSGIPFKEQGHIAEIRRLMGIALAPQITDYIADYLDGSDGEKIVLFGWHIEVLDIFDQNLSRYGTVRIDGRKNPSQRHAAVQKFINDPYTRVINGNMQSMGTGVDGLQTVSSRCYLGEPDWVPAQNEQAVSRLDRYGQENEVTAGIFVAPGSISEKIFVRALEKMNVIHRVMDKEGL